MRQRGNKRTATHYYPVLKWQRAGISSIQIHGGRIAVCIVSSQLRHLVGDAQLIRKRERLVFICRCALRPLVNSLAGRSSPSTDQVHVASAGADKLDSLEQRLDHLISVYRAKKSHEKLVSAHT